MSATNRGTTRNKNDFYPTPEEAFKPLIPLLPFPRFYWEPCAGDGRIIRWLREAGHMASGADLYPHSNAGGVYATLPVDFLNDNTPREFVITNPPFSMAQEFVTQACKRAPEVMMLLRLNFLGSQKRAAWWTKNEPNALFVLSARPDFTGGGGDSCEYAWFYWGPRFMGIRHLSGNGIPWTAEDEKDKARHRCGFEGEPGAPFDEPLGGKEDV